MDTDGKLPDAYLERVYAGVLGKVIGVYLGRPFEGWTYQRIMQELGPIQYYVNDRLGKPLVVVDDDVSGTFTFIRALEDYGISPDLAAVDIGKAWLNYICEDRTILWWGGNGTSTEHTAWLNLRKGIPAPASGSAATNGRTVAEQIGAQIFIDGWAMVAPCQPHLAARLAEQAARVSHDGEAVHAAMLWAAMEAEAFRNADIDALLDVGLSVIPAHCLIARLIADIRQWHRQYPDWRDCRQRIEDIYGYDKYPGNCHVVPNHALMIMAVLYAPDDFQHAQMIVNTSGWDTDCNAGNVGCLLGIMLGLDGLEAGPDWRGPLADRMVISSADGGNSINDAVRVAQYLADLGRRLSGAAPLPAPKGGARFHFSLPGSRQGFRALPIADTGTRALLDNVVHADRRMLRIGFDRLGPGQVAVVTTPTFSPPDLLELGSYDLMATPLVYPGQTLTARVLAPVDNQAAVAVRLRLRFYDESDRLRDADSDVQIVEPGQDCTLTWQLPQLDGQPIAEIGLALSAPGRQAAGTLLLDHMGWTGAPDVALRRPDGGGQYWQRAWVNGADNFSTRFPPSYRLSQSRGVGMVMQGTRDWTDYVVATQIVMHMGRYGGVAVRVQGLRRYYGVKITQDNQLQIVRVRDDVETVLASVAFPFALDEAVPLDIHIAGRRMTATVAGLSLWAQDSGALGFDDGGVGLFVFEGALSCDRLHISAPPTMVRPIG